MYCLFYGQYIYIPLKKLVYGTIKEIMHTNQEIKCSNVIKQFKVEKF